MRGKGDKDFIFFQFNSMVSILSVYQKYFSFSIRIISISRKQKFILMKRASKRIQDQKVCLEKRTKSNCTGLSKGPEDHHNNGSSIEIDSFPEIPLSKSRRKRKSSCNNEIEESHTFVSSTEKSDSTRSSKKEVYLKDSPSLVEATSIRQPSSMREKKRHKKKKTEKPDTTFDINDQSKMVDNVSPEKSNSIDQSAVAIMTDRSREDSRVATTLVDPGTSLASLFSRQEAKNFSFLNPHVSVSDNKDDNNSNRSNNNNEKILTVMESSSLFSSHPDDGIKGIDGNEEVNQQCPIIGSRYHHHPSSEMKLGKSLMDMELSRDGGLFFFHMNPKEPQLSSLGWSTLKQANLFVRDESLEEIEDHWNSVKSDLTKEYKRKHKSAIRKQSKRHGRSRV